MTRPTHVDLTPPRTPRPRLAPLSLALAACLTGCFDPGTKAMDDGTSSGSASGSADADTDADADGSGDEGVSASSAGTADDAAESEDDAPGTTDGETGDDTSSDTGEPEPTCGDGNLDEGEECDDGNRNDLDACSTACRTQYASGNDAPCTDELAAPCDYEGAQCRLDADGSDAICYWPASGDQTACDDTAGIWTPSNGGYAMAHPEMSFPAAGACITEATNLRCSPMNAATCGSAGATLCIQSIDPTGLENTGPDLCWWDTDESGCDATSGIWTTSDDGFVDNHPHALPAGSMGACITQVTNL